MIFKIKNSQLKTIINESFRGERGLINLGNDSVEKIALNNAKIMLSNKEPLLKIKQTTGWEIGYDGKWKYENIDGNIIQIPHSQIHVLSDIWDDDDLYKWYPEIKNVKIILNNNGNTYTSDDGQSINIDKNLFYDEQGNFKYSFYKDELEMAIQHEIQHLIQFIENCEEKGARCPNTRLVADLEIKIKFIKRIVENIKGLTINEIKTLYKNCNNKEEKIIFAEIISYLVNGYNLNDYLNDEINDLNKLKIENEKIAKDYYANKGEMEAYEVNLRYGMSYDQRKNSLMSKRN